MHAVAGGLHEHVARGAAAPPRRACRRRLRALLAGKQDPYAVITVGSKSFKSKVHTGGGALHQSSCNKSCLHVGLLHSPEHASLHALALAGGGTHPVSTAAARR